MYLVEKVQVPFLNEFSCAVGHDKQLLVYSTHTDNLNDDDNDDANDNNLCRTILTNENGTNENYYTMPYKIVYNTDGSRVEYYDDYDDDDKYDSLDEDNQDNCDDDNQDNCDDDNQDNCDDDNCDCEYCADAGADVDDTCDCDSPDGCCTNNFPERQFEKCNTTIKFCTNSSTELLSSTEDDSVQDNQELVQDNQDTVEDNNYVQEQDYQGLVNQELVQDSDYVEDNQEQYTNQTVDEGHVLRHLNSADMNELVNQLNNQLDVSRLLATNNELNKYINPDVVMDDTLEE
jgi:hypothetical protein